MPPPPPPPPPCILVHFFYKSIIHDCCFFVFISRIAFTLIHLLQMCTHITHSRVPYYFNSFDWLIAMVETFSALLALCEGNSLVTVEFPSQRSVTRSFDVFFDLRPNKRLSKQTNRRWFKTPGRPLWRHRNVCCQPIRDSIHQCWRRMPARQIRSSGHAM